MESARRKLRNRAGTAWKGQAPAGFRRATVALATLAVFVSSLPATAQTARQRIVRDAEIEALVQDYARPLFKAAGIKADSIEILLVPDPSFNAFVASQRQMFINAGTILDAKTPNEVIGVIAHETGHLAGGHLVRLQQIAQDTALTTMIAGALAMGAMAAGAMAGNGDVARGGVGLMAGISEAGRRNILSDMRSEELAADRSALNYLEATGQSGEGMLTTFRRLTDDTLLVARRVDPYLLSHPLPRERLALLENLVTKSKSYGRADPPELQHRHDMARAKLAAFTEDAQRIGRRYGPGDSSLPARYARAIVAFRYGGRERALPLIEDLIRAEPNNAFFHELKGQVLLEGGRSREAIAPLRKSVSLRPSSGLLRIMLGQALVDSGDRATVDEAIKNLNVGLLADPAVSNGYRTLGRAYALRGDQALAQLAVAQGLMADGQINEAKQHAARAQGKLSPGSPGWLRADDIMSFEAPARTR